MNEMTEHPSKETLDELRAGLLDEDRERSERLLTHVLHCDRCRSDWDRWGEIASAVPQLDPRSQAAMVNRALMTPPRGRHTWWPAVAVAVTLSIGLGVWWSLDGTDPGPQPPIAQQAAVPDVYEDLDFYLWLANQQEDLSSS